MSTRPLVRLFSLIGLAALALASNASAQVASGPFNVRLTPYGATGACNATVDTAAFLAAIAAIPASGGELYIPAGRYCINQTLTISNKSISIRGEGQRNSIVEFVQAAGSSQDGFVFSSTGAMNSTLTVRSLSVVKHGAFGGTAIYASWPTPVGGHGDFGAVTTSIEDIHISYEPWHVVATAGFWNGGIHLHNTTGAKIRNFSIHSQRSPAAIPYSFGIKIDGHSLGARISDGDMSEVEYGIQVLGGAEGGSEGINISNVDVMATWGVYFDGVGGIAIANSAFAASVRGVYLKGAALLSVNNNLIIRTGDAGWVGIDVQPNAGLGQRGIRLIGNTIVVGGTVWNAGILVSDAGGSGVIGSVIQGNQIHWAMYGIWLTHPTVQRSVVTGNVIEGSTYPLPGGADPNTIWANNQVF